MTRKRSPQFSSLALTRRQFLRRTTLAAGAAAFTFPFVGRVLGANERINVAVIGSAQQPAWLGRVNEASPWVACPA